jgi:hypothetical protein
MIPDFCHEGEPNVRFGPEADSGEGPLLAQCGPWVNCHVSKMPKADIRYSFDHVGGGDRPGGTMK